MRKSDEKERPARDENAPEGGGGDGPGGPTDLEGSDWKAALKRTGKGFTGDNLTDWAAALTYYGVLSMFPALLALFSIVGFLGTSAVESLISNVEEAAPQTARDVIVPAIENLQGSSGAASVAAIIGIAVALFSASGYISAFSRASNAIYEVPEGRPFYKLRPMQMGMALVMMLLLVISAIAVVVTGGVAEQVGSFLGVGDTAVTVWNIAKWPVLVLLVSFMFAFLFWAAPNVQQPKFQWLSPGGILAVVLWIAASAGFAFYVANFGSYNETYGTLAGAVVFLIWLWISNIAILLGAELNAELARGKELRAGRGSLDDDKPILPPRSTDKLDEDDPARDR